MPLLVGDGTAVEEGEDGGASLIRQGDQRLFAHDGGPLLLVHCQVT